VIPGLTLWWPTVCHSLNEGEVVEVEEENRGGENEKTRHKE